MNASNWDDPAVEERWCSERRREVSEYLAKEGVLHGKVGSWPAWHLAPYISIWAVESLKAPGHVGWWVICGDMPTDYLSAATVKHPQRAMLAFADRWQEVADNIRSGVPHPELQYGEPKNDPQRAVLLENRSDVLRRFAEDESMWSPEYE